MKRKNILRTAFLTVCVLLTITFSATACYHEPQTETNAPSAEQAENIPAAPPIPTLNRQAELQKAKEQNADTVAWLTVPNTDIDDPVVQAEDNDFYLHLSFDKQYSVWGCYFADYLNTLTGRSSPDTNTVIYGHSHYSDAPTEQKFTQLFHCADIDFVRENPYIYLSVDGEDLIFQVCAVFYTDIEFDYINPFPQEDFYEQVAAKNIYLFNGLTVEKTDKLLTLSTCSHLTDTAGTGNHRFVVMGKLLPEGATVKKITVSENPNAVMP